MASHLVTCAFIAIFLHLASAQYSEAVCEGHACSQDDLADGVSMVQRVIEARMQERLLSSSKSGGGATDLDRTLDCKDGGVKCPAFSGCPDANLCVGVNHAPVVDPDSPYANAANALPGKIAKAVVGTLAGEIPVVGAFFEAAIGIFWPSTDPNIVHQTMFDTMVNWVKDFVQEQISNQVVEELQRTLDGLKEAFKSASLFTPCGESQVASMHSLNQLLTANAAHFQNANLDWQGMTLFPTFVDLHLTVLSYLFRALPTSESEAVINITTEMLNGPGGYIKTAQSFLTRAVDQRLAYINALSEVTRTEDSCSVNFITGQDTWPGCTSWSLDAQVQGVLSCITGGGGQGGAPAYMCFNANCPQLSANYNSCRQQHVDAVQRSWTEFFTNFLISPSEEWPKVLSLMKSDLAAGNYTFPDCQASDMLRSTDLRRAVEEATDMAKYRYCWPPWMCLEFEPNEVANSGES